MDRPAPKSLPWLKIGLPRSPVILAPLAGVSDHPFRRVCTEAGADLTYVEMLSATALTFNSKRTFEMLKRHESERVLGVQLTGRTADEVARAIEILEPYSFETIDINMGCPVQKVVKVGCGSAILKDPERVYQTVKQARAATGKLLSAKIRIGWDRQSINVLETADAIARGGADWLTVHGRCRSDDYSAPVDLDRIAQVVRSVGIPVVGNGNIFCAADAQAMLQTGVDGVMVSRGALGNPWVFDEIKNTRADVSVDKWLTLILKHLAWQTEEYGGKGTGAICMRKHLLWYAKGWPGAKKLREELNVLEDLSDARGLLADFASHLSASGVIQREGLQAISSFVWDPKYEMDRKLDRGVGDDALALV